jgi:predicted MFS family arabinose efflux permease
VLSPEPRFRGLPDLGWTRRYLRTSKGRSVLRLLLLGAAMQLAVYVGSPYFGPYMLEGLQFTYAEYMAASVAVVLAKVAILPLWGRAVDTHGARSIYLFAALLVALVPLPWLVTHGLMMAIFAQVLSGCCWGAYEVSFFSLILEVTYRATRPYVFAAQNVLQGTTQLMGGMIGALLLGRLGRSFLTIFVVSAAARAVVALAAPRILPRLAFQSQIGHRALFLRVIGIRPHGGLTHRPIEESREA